MLNNPDWDAAAIWTLRVHAPSKRVIRSTYRTPKRLSSGFKVWEVARDELTDNAGSDGMLGTVRGERLRGVVGLCEDEFDGDACDARADEGFDLFADVGREGGDNAAAEIVGEVDDLAVGHDAVGVVVHDGVIPAWARRDGGGDLPTEAVGEEEVEGVVDGGEAEVGVVVADDA